jgi:hypothetical protein
MIDLTKILIAIIDVVALLITYKLIPWIKAHTTNEQQKFIEAAITTGVFAAEQIYGAGHGPEKMEFVKKYLNGKGFDVNTTEIEAVVYNYMNRGDKNIVEPADTNN